MRSRHASAKSITTNRPNPTALALDLRELIQVARRAVAQGMVSSLTPLDWQFGQRVRRDILMDLHGDYGAKIVSALRRQLIWTHFNRLIYLDDTAQAGLWRGHVPHRALERPDIQRDPSLPLPDRRTAEEGTGAAAPGSASGTGAVVSREERRR